VRVSGMHQRTYLRLRAGPRPPRGSHFDTARFGPTKAPRTPKTSLAACDLPLNFHPAAFRASTNVTPFGAVSVPA
jgi:hypothetical protein